MRDRTLSACCTAQTVALAGRKMTSDREANVVFTVGNEVHSTKTYIRRKKVISMRKQLLHSLVAVSTVVLLITQTAPRARI